MAWVWQSAWVMGMGQKTLTHDPHPPPSGAMVMQHIIPTTSIYRTTKLYTIYYYLVATEGQVRDDKKVGLYMCTML